MKAKSLCLWSCLAVLLIAGLHGQPEADREAEIDWSHVDDRVVPEWFRNAKFGIFIHWGVYSVPAWTPSGTYSEWYQYWLETESLFGNGDFTGREVADFHRRVYGSDTSYYDLASDFRAELYDPAAWAELFRRAGARYVVMTSKHHDGFALWPSREASENWGHPWNSTDIGPRRDLVGEYMAAMRQQGLKAGLYYSLYEWFHPWYREDFPRFVREHFQPQFRDLINRYGPDIAWADGEWEHSAEEWRTPQLLRWLLQDSPVADTVVINDRWGRGTRHEHGGFFTTEYEAEGLGQARPWEECRGMALSFGYNRDEDIDDYNSPKVLILMLADVVSRGGNLLLDIGPKSDGTIPVIMQERLLQIGKWLQRHGEAIYGTRPWIRPVQWGGEGPPHTFERTETMRYIPGDYILKQTVDAEEGHSFKEIFFTRKEDTLYAILPEWPGEEITIREFPEREAFEIHLLGYEVPLSWRRSGQNLTVDLPAFSPDLLTPGEVYVVKIRTL